MNIYRNSKRNFAIGMFCLGTILILAPVSGVAETTTYTDRSLWAAQGTDIYTQDFESFGADTSFASAPLDIGQLRFEMYGTSPEWRNLVDVEPFLFSGTPPSFGSAAVDFFIDEDLTASIRFDNAVSGFFADFLWAGNTSELTLTLLMLGGGAESYQVPGPGSSLSPFGFWSSTSNVSAIQLSNSLNDGFYIDNLSLSHTPISMSSMPAVPVPPAIWLFASALVGLAGFARRRNSGPESKLQVR